MRYLACLFFLFASITSCSGQATTNNSFDPVPQSIVLLVKIERFDKDFDKYLKSPTKQGQQVLESKYSSFLPAFGRVTINNSDSYKAEFYKRLEVYFSNEMLKQIYQQSLTTFANTQEIESELSFADNLISQNFSGRRLPALSMHVSGFKENVMVLDNLISLSADKYLGQDFPLYRQFFEPYLLIQMQPEMVTRDYLKAWLLSEKLLKNEDKKNLLSEIINEGKILYALSQLLPQKTDEILIGYTPEQLKWCRDNEKNVWLKIIEQNHLYNTDALLIQKYVTDAPYTSTISTDSPGKMGAWMGWQIVKSYINKNNISLADLLNSSAQEILKKSNYTP